MFGPLETADLRAGLAILLATPHAGRPASRWQVDAFCRYLASCPVQWEGLRCGPSKSPSGIFFALVLPGRTAVVMVPSPGEHGIDLEDQRRVTAAGLERLAARQLHYAQALIEPQATRKRELLEKAGFQPLAPLVYLEREVDVACEGPPRSCEVTWVRYQERNRAEFAAVILATYEDSQDCPELTGLRPIEDVLASHQASGQFDPALWEIARLGAEPAGCLLLSRVAHAPMLELVYMGVTPAYRRRGIGSLLLRRALEQCRAVGARRLTAVVDARNEPARRLYARFCLAPVARRDALLYRWERAQQSR